MPITRFAVLPDERRLIIGLDKNNLFEAGHVYECYDILDTIVFKKIGPFALPKKGPYPNQNSDVNSQIECGMHLILMTEAEISKAQNKTSNRP